MLRLRQLILLACLAKCTADDEYDDEEDDEPHPQCSLHYAQLDRSKNGIEYEFRRTKEGYTYHHKKYTPGSYPDISDHHENGVIRNIGTDKEELVVTGAHSYKVGYFELVVEYTADKNGYRPKIYWKKFPCGIAVSPSVKLLQNLGG